MNLTQQQIVSVVAPGKLNLTFEILGTREDGYHEVATVFHAIDLADTIVFVAQPDKEFSVELSVADDGSFVSIPLDDSNLICRACHAFNQFVGESPGFSLRVMVKKAIPVGAGLAGGSADAAAALLAMNRLTQRSLALTQLQEIASDLGSDVTFCLTGGTALGLGRGEKLTAASNSPEYDFVIFKPKQVSVSTPWAYKTYDQTKAPGQSQTAKDKSERVLAMFAQGNFQDAPASFGNDFEALIFEHFPYLKEAKQSVIALGPIACHLTGKGPTMYALARDSAQAEQLIAHIKKLSYRTTSSDGLRYETITFDAWIAKSLAHGAKIVASS